jgi:hypothetical protein
MRDQVFMIPFLKKAAVCAFPNGAGGFKKQQYVLTRDVAGMDAAQKGAGLPELLGGAEAPGGNLRHGLRRQRGFRFAALLRGDRETAAQALRVEAAGQKVIDGDVFVGDLARDPGQECGEAGPCSARQIESGQGHFDADGGDVHDPPESAARHGVDDLLNEFDGRHHVHRHAGEHRLPIQFAKIAERRTAVIVDQYVGGRARRQQRLLAFHG